ncbi:MAG: flagellar hook protein FlgE [Hyphomicrobiales bacterium]|nr:flagellar hook protein FlgE [Hyphomicrobiales bacterium]
MSVLNTLHTSISGINAQSRKLATIADNIANSSTVGYKRADTQFSTLINDVPSRNYNSGGVEAIARHIVDGQGVTHATGNATDLAIQGNGFFYVTGPDGSPALTRAGSFRPDKNGELRNVAGFYLMGLRAPEGGAADVTSTNINDLERVDLNQFTLIANPTTEAIFTANLPATATAPAGNLPSANVATSAYNAKSSLVTFDNLGQKVTLDIYFTKTAANQWEMAVYNAADATAGGFPYGSAALAVQTVAFDGTTGNITGAPGINLTVPNGQPMTIDLSHTTQLAADYQIMNAQSDGNSATTIDRVEVGEDGALSAIYQDGTRRIIYNIPLATVASPHNLAASSGNIFRESAASGSVVLGAPDTAGLGSLISASLESSNVDLGAELTSLIETQRAYTANSKTFKTASELIDVLMSIRS